MTPLLTGVFASQISGRLAPSLTGSFEALGTVTVPGGGLSSVSFTGIPQNYSHLQLRCIIKTTTNSNSDGGIYYRFNDDSGANYSNHAMRGSGSGSVTSDGGGGSTILSMGFATGSNSNNTNTFAAYVIDILDYKDNTKFKTTRSLEGYDLNGVEGSMFFRSNNWRSLNGVSKITFQGSTFAENSQFALYGVK